MKKLISTRLCLLLCLFLMGCDGARKAYDKEDSNKAFTPERTTGGRGGSLRYRVISPPKTFNYLMASDEPSFIVSFYLMGSRLVEFDHDRQTYVPALAASWNATDDGRTYEIELREGAKFSDAHPLSASDVEFTLRALYDERTASPIMRDLMMISGRQIEAVVIDERHLRLTFPEQIAAPESYLSNIAVLPRHTLEDALNKGSLREAYSLTSDLGGIVVSGPFLPQASAAGESVNLKRNPHYWKRDEAGVELPYLDAITVLVIPDMNNAVTRLNGGELDIIDRLRPTDYAALQRAPQEGDVGALDLGPGLNTDHMWFNLNTGKRADGAQIVDPAKLQWFSDVRFRRAVSHAIDRRSIAESSLQGLATPLYGFISTGNRAWGSQNLPRTEYDLDKARALLGEAGFVLRGTQEAPELYDGQGNRVEWTLILPVENEPRKAMAAMIQEDLARLGIRMHIAPVDFGEMTRRWSQSFDYDAALGGVVASEPDPSSYVGFLRSSSEARPWYPKAQEAASSWERRLDELLAAQARERNPDLRRQSFFEVQGILAEHLPVIPIVARHISVAARKRIGNYRPSTLVPYSLWNAEELFMR